MASALMVLTGCALFGGRPETTLRIHEQVGAGLPESRARIIDVPGTGLKIPVSPYAQMTERDVQAAELYHTAGGDAVLLRFDIHGTVKFDELTTRMRGQYLVVFVDDEPAAAWLVDRRVTDGQFLLEADFTDEQARQIVDSLSKTAKKNRR
jgi:preprotein translocase subunit SecD